MQVDAISRAFPVVASDAPPLHHRLADALRLEIESGRYPRGSQLPSEHDLAGRHAVARGTVRQALATLRAEGAIAVRRGARPVVLGLPRTQSFAELQSFTSWARALGEHPSGRVIELGRRAASREEAAALGVDEGERVLALVRVRMLDDRPVMVERTCFPPPIGSLLAACDLERASIYEQLAELGVEVAQARHAIDAVGANTRDARVLGLARRTPLLRDRRLGLAADGSPIEWSDDRYRPDAVSFGVDNAAAASPLTRLSTRDTGVTDVDRRTR
jgi:GntR family transcriptional regulator